MMLDSGGWLALGDDVRLDGAIPDAVPRVAQDAASDTISIDGSMDIDGSMKQMVDGSKDAPINEYMAVQRVAHGPAAEQFVGEPLRIGLVVAAIEARFDRERSLKAEWDAVNELADAILADLAPMDERSTYRGSVCKFVQAAIDGNRLDLLRYGIETTRRNKAEGKLKEKKPGAYFFGILKENGICRSCGAFIGYRRTARKAARLATSRSRKR